MNAPTDLYGSKLKLPRAHTPVQRREKRPSKYQQAKDKKNARYDWYVATADPDETWFRHYNWQADRAKVRDALIGTWANEFQMNRFDECGSECLVEWSESEQRHRLRANHCKCRHCRPCNKAKGGLLSANLKKRLEKGPNDGCRFRFITLTLRHDRADELKPLLTRLYKCFAELRKTKLWKDSQDGGCSILEVKWSASTGWHPHLHIIAEGGWLRAETLQKAWHGITTDSYKADIRALNDIKDTCYYVAKYVGKGVNDEMWQHKPAAVEYILAMKGVRFCATFGKWRGFALLQPDKAHEAKDWVAVGLLAQIAARAREGVMVDILLLMTLEEALQYNPHKKRNTTKRDESTA